VRDIRHMISLGDRTEPNLWRAPVLKTVAARGDGVDEVMSAIEDHFAWMETSGALRDRRVRRAGDEIQAIAIQALRARIGDLRHGQGVDELAAQVVDGSSDPYRAADQVVAALT
jgi:GTPase